MRHLATTALAAIAVLAVVHAGLRSARAHDIAVPPLVSAVADVRLVKTAAAPPSDVHAAAAPLAKANAAAAPPTEGVVAEHARLATRSLLLGVTMAGNRLIAVGERGHILLSDDHGSKWTQADSVPTRALLTGVCFSNPRHGIAVGHDEVILTTQDSGHTWTLAHSAPQSQQPLLDVACMDGGRVLAVGAHGVYFVSADGRSNWRERSLGQDFHLNRIAVASPTRLYIAAEGGHLYRSDDAGENWHELSSGYEGSFFGVRPLSGDVVLACGLRGNLFRSENAGVTWRKLETGTSALLNDVVTLDSDRSIVAVGLSGVAIVSRDGGKSFLLMQQEDRRGLSAAMAVGAHTLVVVGEGGARRIEVNSP